MIGWPLLVLIASPLLILVAPFYLIALRRLEKTDPEVCPTADQKHCEDLSRFEDHDVTNQFSAMGSLKPGLVRLADGNTCAQNRQLWRAAYHAARYSGTHTLDPFRTLGVCRWALSG